MFFVYVCLSGVLWENLKMLTVYRTNGNLLSTGAVHGIICSM